MPKGYWIAHIDVADTASYDRYKALASAAATSHGARYLVRGGAQDLVEGTARSRTVVLEFPTIEAARACYFGPAYQEARAIRQAASAGDFLIVEGAGD